MLKYIALLLVSAVISVRSQSPSFGKCPDVKTQETLDLEKYVGYWYEVFAFPTVFDVGKCTRAQYIMKPNGHIEVHNRSIENGKVVNGTGDAYRPDDNQQGKLVVKFASGQPEANYWVVHTNYESYTLVYSCSSIANLAHIEFAWILARNQTLDPSIVTQLKNELASNGIDASKFKASDQTNCPL